MVRIPGGKPLRLGPFIGGLNTGSDVSAIADAELTECVNYELDIDGSLVSRPPFQEMDGGAGWTERILVLCEGIFSGVHYLIGSNINGVYQYTAGAWTLITSTFRAATAVQFANKVYLVAHPASANPGGKWDPAGGFTAVAAIPKGQACVVHKERLFVVPGTDATTNTTRLTFSDPGNFDVWPASNFVDVGQGDGTNLKDITVYQDNLLLFKDQSTYVLAYDVRPADAVVRKISLTIGVEAQNCVVNFENQVYIYYNGWVYEIVNYDFHRLNTKVPFILDQTAPSAFSAEAICLGICGDRLIIRYYNKTYVYGLKTRTFTEWSSTRTALHYFGPIVTIHDPAGDQFYSGSSLSASRSLIRLFDSQSANIKEQTVSPPSSLQDTFTRTVSNGWGSTDTAQVWTLGTGGVAGDFAVATGNGSITHGTRNVVRDIRLAAVNYSDFEASLDGSIPVVVTGSQTMSIDLTFRSVDLNNCYVGRLDFGVAGAATVQLYRVIAGTPVLLGSLAIPGTQAANDKYTFKVRCQGTSIKVKAWKTSGLEPIPWMVSVTDATFASGNIGVDSTLGSLTTNALPIITSHDNLKIGILSDAITDILCHVKTKNFDMAVSNQFKKLWWWGADITTSRIVTGTASPVVLNFSVTWDQLAAVSWDALKTWDQPLTDLATVITVVSTSTGVARRFVKFKKALRYRQINFQIDMKTDGSTVDGPARIFTMMIITETKQGVSKAVS